MLVGCGVGWWTQRIQHHNPQSHRRSLCGSVPRSLRSFMRKSNNNIIITEKINSQDKKLMSENKVLTIKKNKISRISREWSFGGLWWFFTFGHYFACEWDRRPRAVLVPRPSSTRSLVSPWSGLTTKNLSTPSISCLTHELVTIDRRVKGKRRRRDGTKRPSVLQSSRRSSFIRLWSLCCPLVCSCVMGGCSSRRLAWTHNTTTTNHIMKIELERRNGFWL